MLVIVTWPRLFPALLAGQEVRIPESERTHCDERPRTIRCTCGPRQPSGEAWLRSCQRLPLMLSVLVCSTLIVGQHWSLYPCPSSTSTLLPPSPLPNVSSPALPLRILSKLWCLQSHWQNPLRCMFPIFHYYLPTISSPCQSVHQALIAICLKH